MTRTQIDPSLSSGLTTFAAPVNIVDNGGMEIWQRGSTFTNAVSGAYSADRWKQAGNTTAHVISQDSTFVDSGQYSFKWNITSTTGASIYQQETIENYQAYLGKTVTLSMRIKATAPIQIWLTDGLVATYSASHPGDNQWHTISITATISNSATALGTAFGFSTISTSTGTYYIDSIMLVNGSTAATFVPTHPAVDLTRCQRYYETYGAGAPPICGVPYNNAAGTQAICDLNLPYKVTKRVNPALTITMTQVIDNVPAPGANTPVTDTPAWSATNNSGDLNVAALQLTRAGALASARVISAQFTMTVSADL